MKTFRNSRQIASAASALLAAVALGIAGTAAAQQNSTGGTVGGSSTDNTSAGNANGTGMPQIQQQGAVSYVSGGVGEDESMALRQAAHRWPLSLRFTGTGGNYLADIHVKIADAHGTNVLDTTSLGPYMLVKVPPGRYSVHASYAGVAKTSAVTVGSSGTARASFTW
ncbi:MAG: carboxypeptidase regulatory-like domain-containing protein [Paraburkholderia sp.]|uniref:carboxypeptidase regulatory-like domain-containing protein n=1 Tax=Paraburkholderia sp. TaxID=1926495 RepID=UPI0011F5F6C3|nr:carboxypeptidase regulatory-like domain-containing protein [Paraburkholderia sp.]TAM01942.1 MAG: carboxypeptidase regulatory-like domain-containing protein [Paraburkholderia sp.]TAM29639.1 MAG: carboxypeptidase regulatory-like domain-containing protein [Paraburkholderia sp.]